jgi:hypothetical protein
MHGPGICPHGNKRKARQAVTCRYECVIRSPANSHNRVLVASEAGYFSDFWAILPPYSGRTII